MGKRLLASTKKNPTQTPKPKKTTPQTNKQKTQEKIKSTLKEQLGKKKENIYIGRVPITCKNLLLGRIIFSTGENYLSSTKSCKIHNPNITCKKYTVKTS